MMKKVERLTFVEKRSDLSYLKAKITDKLVTNNYVTQGPSKMLLEGRDDEDSETDENGMPKIEEKNYDDSNSSGEKEEDSNPMPRTQTVARNKRVLLKDFVINNHIAIKEKLDTKSVNDDHHKW